MIDCQIEKFEQLCCKFRLRMWKKVEHTFFHILFFLSAQKTKGLTSFFPYFTTETSEIYSEIAYNKKEVATINDNKKGIKK